MVRICFAQNVYWYLLCLLKKVTWAVVSSLPYSQYTSGWICPWAPSKKSWTRLRMVHYTTCMSNAYSLSRTAAKTSKNVQLGEPIKNEWPFFSCHIKRAQQSYFRRPHKLQYCAWHWPFTSKLAVSLCCKHIIIIFNFRKSSCMT